jgi:predicted O-methyltransferase YrrM
MGKYSLMKVAEAPLISLFVGRYLSNKFLREFEKVPDDIDAYIDFSYSFRSLGISIRPSQIRYEIRQLLEVLRRVDPRYVLEIGTAGGGTLFLLCRVACDDATIISIDLPDGYPDYRVPLYMSFGKPGQRIFLVREDSHNYETLVRVKHILGGELLDFLFIDGDHTYEGVKKDFEMYGPLVRRGGFIAFHDIVPDYYTRYGVKTASYTGGVPRFWNEIRESYDYIEIVEDWGQDGYGIGVIRR